MIVASCLLRIGKLHLFVGIGGLDSGTCSSNAIQGTPWVGIEG